MQSLFRSMVVAMAVMSSQFSFAEGINFENLSLDEALQKAKEQDKVIFIDIYAVWCGPCKYLSKEVFTDDELGAFMNENFINLKLDGEEGDGDALMRDFGLDAYPTMLFLSADRVEKGKIVGAVSASEILSTANEVLHPETSALFQLTEKYENGDRSKEVLQDYIEVLLDKDKDFEPVVAEYLEKYPELDLKDEDEFLIFCLGVNDRENKFSQDFFKNIETYKGLHEGLTSAKMNLFMVGLVAEAQEADDVALIDQGLDELYPPFNTVFAEEMMSRKEIHDILVEMYHSEQ